MDYNNTFYTFNYTFNNTTPKNPKSHDSMEGKLTKNLYSMSDDLPENTPLMSEESEDELLDGAEEVQGKCKTYYTPCYNPSNPITQYSYLFITTKRITRNNNYYRTHIKRVVAIVMAVARDIISKLSSLLSIDHFQMVEVPNLHLFHPDVDMVDEEPHTKEEEVEKEVLEVTVEDEEDGRSVQVKGKILYHISVKPKININYKSKHKTNHQKCLVTICCHIKMANQNHIARLISTSFHSEVDKEVKNTNEHGEFSYKHYIWYVIITNLISKYNINITTALLILSFNYQSSADKRKTENGDEPPKKRGRVCRSEEARKRRAERWSTKKSERKNKNKNENEKPVNPKKNQKKSVTVSKGAGDNKNYRNEPGAGTSSQGRPRPRSDGNTPKEKPLYTVQVDKLEGSTTEADRRALLTTLCMTQALPGATEVNFTGVRLAGESIRIDCADKESSVLATKVAREELDGNSRPLYAVEARRLPQLTRFMMGVPGYMAEVGGQLAIRMLETQNQRRNGRLPPGSIRFVSMHTGDSRSGTGQSSVMYVDVTDEGVAFLRNNDFTLRTLTRPCRLRPADSSGKSQ